MKETERQRERNRDEQLLMNNIVYTELSVLMETYIAHRMACPTKDAIPRERTACAEHSHVKGQGSGNGKLFWIVGGGKKKMKVIITVKKKSSGTQ